MNAGHSFTDVIITGPSRHRPPSCFIDARRRRFSFGPGMREEGAYNFRSSSSKINGLSKQWDGLPNQSATALPRLGIMVQKGQEREGRQ